MLYQPTFPSPYMETIDIENPAGNVFKCLINPKNKVVGYRIDILLNLDNTLCCQIKGYLEEIDGALIQKKVYSIDSGTTWNEFESIPEEDSLLPIIGNFSDDSWLQVLLPSDIDLGLSNDNEYKWNITLEQEDYDIKVLTGTTPQDGYSASGYVCLEVNPLVQPELIIEIRTTTDGTLRHVIEKVNYYKTNNNGNPVQVSFEEATYIRAYLKDYSFTTDIGQNNSYTIYDNHLQTYDYYFKTRNTPAVTFEVPNTITKSSNIFTAIVDKNISSFKFDLYLGTELIDTSENIYSNNISYIYDGFISGNKYSIKLTVITEDDEIIIEEREFNVQYYTAQSTLLIKSEMDNISNGICLDFGSQVSIPGIISENEVIYKKYTNPTEEIPKTENSVRLGHNQSLYWNYINNGKELNILNNSSTIIHWHGDLGFNNNIALLSSSESPNERVLIGYNSKTFYYKIGTGDVVYYTPYTKGYANAIAGRDEYSVAGQIIDNNNNIVVVPLTENVEIGMYISILGERRRIINIANSDNTALTLETPFDLEISSGDNFFIYDELRCYVFYDEDIPKDEDIFIENDIGYNYWWLIVILPNEVRFKKTQRYKDTVVSE